MDLLTVLEKTTSPGNDKKNVGAGCPTPADIHFLFVSVRSVIMFILESEMNLWWVMYLNWHFNWFSDTRELEAAQQFLEQAAQQNLVSLVQRHDHANQDGGANGLSNEHEDWSCDILRFRCFYLLLAVLLNILRKKGTCFKQHDGLIGGLTYFILKWRSWVQLSSCHVIQWPLEQRNVISFSMQCSLLPVLTLILKDLTKYFNYPRNIRTINKPIRNWSGNVKCCVGALGSGNVLFSLNLLILF